MAMPPWRRNGYMTAKWFGSYKRTTSAVSAGKASSDSEREDNHASGGKRRVGFEALPNTFYFCRHEILATKIGRRRVGLVTAAFESGF